MTDSIPTPGFPEGFTRTVQFADGIDTIEARIASNQDIEVGYTLDFRGYEDGLEGAQPFIIDRRHIGDFIELLQSVKDSL
ncbi:hypothetical protein [Citricoccus nitrophenolicus]|uniref:hypothetical protein n=1 Tax=Citricoccus nitrophenolicus TaxID=863575 RepID=UPI0031E85DCC